MFGSMFDEAIDESLTAEGRQQARRDVGYLEREIERRAEINP
jgi:hypothetical protein